MLKRRSGLLFLGIWICSSGPIAAAPAVFSVGLDSRYTNNATQAPFNEESDLESRVFVGVQHSSDPGNCNSELAAQVGYSRWLDETFSPETTANADFEGDCRLGSNLVWEASDYLRDVVRDSRVNNTPNNRTQKNVFRTGPILTFRLGAVDELLLSASYENTEFREPEQKDGERYSGSVGWNHFFSPSFSAGLRASADQSELDTEEEFDRVSVSAPFNKAWAATSLSGAVGYGRIESSLQNSSPRKYDSFVGNLLLVRQINVTTELEIEASRELTDQTSDFDTRFDDFIFNLDQTSAVEVTAVRLGVNNDLGASTFDIGLFANRSDYLDIRIEEDSAGIDAAFRRPLTGQLNWTVGARYELFRYSADDTEDDVIRVNTGIDFQLNRQLSFVSVVGYEKRTSDVLSREFDEAWVLVGVEYLFR
ncbi:outer membrane beta-barrel protein [Marinobacter sp. F4218]|uniref:outer membrane beta-barrel protein n=1 Tax=Marinobacter sp. F4218 TaxID=2862868 RepID=UPI001C62EC91|nr:outer membrane beta-barrel protein [Marinobacter sp. F4218]MBW7470072.1 outer membrane beta-barrel protein [Marinobacter sp. F4218]